MALEDAKKTELFLVLRAQTGDMAAFNELFRLIQPRFYRYIRHLVGDAGLAEDLLQEVFLIIYKKIGWLDDPSLFRAWAYRIASRKCFRHMRGRRFEWADDDELAAIPADQPEPVFEPELAARVPDLISRLSPQSRTAILLHYVDEFSLSETAEILNISVGTAKSRVAYGLKVLRRLVAEGV